MKNTKLNQEKGKRNAEAWVEVARAFGEKCVEVQHDPKLNLDQKLKKQDTLCNEMKQEIQNDSFLSKEDKKIMIDSINNYMNDWKKMHEALKAISLTPNEKKKSK